MMKRQRRSGRQMFVLTLEEKKTLACVFGAFLLGLVTQHYRATHPRPPPPLTARQQYEAQRAARANASRAHSARRQAAAAAAERATPVEEDETD